MRLIIRDRNRELDIPAGASLLDVMMDAGVNIMHACGGNCICGTCNVEILAGQENLAPAAEAERIILSKIKRHGANVRLACQSFASGDVTIQISL